MDLLDSILRIRQTNLTAINFPSEISLSIQVSLPSQFCFCTSLPFSRVTTVCGATEQRQQAVNPPAQWRPPRWLWCVQLPSRHRTNPCLPVVGGHLLKRLVEFELDFGVFEGALRLHANCPLIVHGDHQVGLGPITHLPGRESNTCRGGERPLNGITYL